MTVAEFSVLLFVFKERLIERKVTAATVVLYHKAIFGKGAVEAAKFLAGKPAGRYDMSDVIG